MALEDSLYEAAQVIEELCKGDLETIMRDTSDKAKRMLPLLYKLHLEGDLPADAEKSLSELEDYAMQTARTAESALRETNLDSNSVTELREIRSEAFSIRSWAFELRHKILQADINQFSEAIKKYRTFKFIHDDFEKPEELAKKYQHLAANTAMKLFGLIPAVDMPIKAIDLAYLVKEFSEIPSLAKYTQACLTYSMNILTYMAVVNTFDEEEIKSNIEKK